MEEYNKKTKAELRKLCVSRKIGDARWQLTAGFPELTAALYRYDEEQAKAGGMPAPAPAPEPEAVKPETTPEPEAVKPETTSAPAPAPVAATVPAPEPVQANAFVDGLAAMLQGRIKTSLDAAEVRAQVKDICEPMVDAVKVTMETMTGDAMLAITKRIEEIDKPRRIECFRQPEAAPIDIGVQHYMFPLLLELSRCRVNMFIVGPAGSGKTSVAATVAKALGLKFYFQSFCQQSSKTDIMGYQDAHSNYVRTLFREAYEKGGVYLMDEGDNANANVLNVLNSATSNGHCAFPDGMVEKHADFILMLAANTYGDGANRRYVGRSHLDAAFKDRFFYVDFPYDEGLEAAICGIDKHQKRIKLQDGDFIDAADWLTYVHKVRAAVDKLKLDHVVSPRASITGSRINATVGRRWLEEGLIWRGMDKPTRGKVTAEVLAS